MERLIISFKEQPPRHEDRGDQYAVNKGFYRAKIDAMAQWLREQGLSEQVELPEDVNTFGILFISAPARLLETLRMAPDIKSVDRDPGAIKAQTLNN